MYSCEVRDLRVEKSGQNREEYQLEVPKKEVYLREAFVRLAYKIDIPKRYDLGETNFKIGYSDTIYSKSITKRLAVAY